MLQGKIWGIPYILIALVVVIVSSIYLPMFALNATTQGKLDTIERVQFNTNREVNRLLITPTPSATPSASPTVTPAVKQQFFIAPPVKPTGK